MISDELNRIQLKLHDSAAIWSRAELLRWWSDGYRQLLALSKGAVRFWNLDVPGGFTFAHTQEWEANYGNGTHNRFSLAIQSGNLSGTYLWETEFIEGITPTNSNDAVTQPWERVHSGEWDGQFRFALPRDHEQIKRVAWDERRLDPVTVKELDTLERGWNQRKGEPVVFTAGLGKIDSFEIFAIRTDHIQGYELDEAEKGMPRRFTGDRTYTQSLASPPPENAYAYTSAGDAEAVTGSPYDFDPTDSYSNPEDGLHAEGSRPWKFTWDDSTDTQDAPDQGFTATHPWMIENRGTSEDMYGTHPFEHEYGAATKVYADGKPVLDGLGWRFTKAAAVLSDGFAVHIWEKEMQDGATTFTDSVVIGTYSWEAESGAVNVVNFPAGVVRGASSADRQYMPIYLGGTKQRLLGAPRDWRSSKQNVSILQTILPDNDLVETETPDLVPSQMFKYLRYYVWSRAFGRQGEGHNLILASHYERRFRRGVVIFNKLSILTHRDVVYARESIGPTSRRPPRPKLPPEFPRVDI